MTVKILGIVGGMGVAAGIDFNSTMLECGIGVSGRTDAVHADRVAYLSGAGESPVATIADAVEKLFDSGADVVVMACNTAHAVYDELLDSVPARMADNILHLTDVAVSLVKAQAALWLGTTVLAHETSLVRRYDIRLPQDTDQEIVQRAIWEAKVGSYPYSKDMRRIANGNVVAGCTEMPAILRAAGVSYINPANALAQHIRRM